jgi:hypothetical protein
VRLALGEQRLGQGAQTRAALDEDGEDQLPPGAQVAPIWVVPSRRASGLL